MKTSAAGWFALIAILPFALNATGSFARQWPIQGSCAATGACRVTLTPDVYAAAYWPDLRDVQVLDANGRPVASAIDTASHDRTTGTRSVALNWFTLPRTTLATGVPASIRSVVVQTGPNHETVSIQHAGNAGPPSAGAPAQVADPIWLIDTGAEAGRLSNLMIGWNDSATSFDLGYRLEGSADLQQWTTLNPEVRLVQLRQAGRELRSGSIPLNTTLRYLRLVPLQRATDLVPSSFRGDVREAAVPVAWQWLPVRAASSTSNSYTYQTPGQLPVERLDLQLPANSTATWAVFSRDINPAAPSAESTAWQVRATGWETFNLGSGNAQQASAALDLGNAIPDRQWRLVAPPGTHLSEAPTLRLGYRVGTVVFLAQGQAPYRLVAGSADATQRHTDLGPVVNAMRERAGSVWQPTVMQLGAGSQLAGPAAYEPAPAPRDWKNLLLWIVLVAGAATVAGLAITLLRGKQPDA